MADPTVLSKLRDIHLPSPIGWWPLAPGWYLLLAACLIILLILSYRWYCIYQQGLAKRKALDMLSLYLEEYQKQPDSQIYAMKISELLRRVALVYYPREKVASLQGEAWVDFLAKTSKKIEVKSCANFLLEVPYQPSGNFNLEPFFSLAKAWIKQRGKPCLN